MRQRTKDALREYYEDAIDGAALPRETSGNPPSLDPTRKDRVIFQAIKELVQDNADQQRTIDQLVGKVGLP